FANGKRVNVPYRFDKVVCVRVVHVVHAQCFFVVVDRNINRTTERHFHAERCTATAGKIVDKQFFRQVQAKLATIGIVNVHYAATSSSTRVTFSQRTHCSSSHVSSVNETKPSSKFALTISRITPSRALNFMPPVNFCVKKLSLFAFSSTAAFISGW